MANPKTGTGLSSLFIMLAAKTPQTASATERALLRALTAAPSAPQIERTTRAVERELRIGNYRELAIQVLLRRTTMRHSVLLLFLFAGDTVLFAAGSPDLLVAIRNGDHVQVQKLLGTGADVNTVDNDGTTALMHSVIDSDVKMMNLLIGHAANVNAKNALASTALMYAATNLAKARVLLDAGADVKAWSKYAAKSMHLAVTDFGSPTVLKLLVNKGAEPEARLMASAAAMGDLEAMQYLLSVGVPEGGLTGAAISAAIAARCEACARLLEEEGAPPNGTRA